MAENCVTCDKPANVVCGGCGKTLYCSEEHKKKQFNSHKINCKPYRVEQNEKYGRYLVSCRDIKRGELILRERPLVVGPQLDSMPSCLECHAPLYSMPAPCSICGLIGICGRCSHYPLECSLLSGLNQEQKNVLLRMGNQHVLPLRVLLNLRSEKGEERFKSILEMESHLEDRRDTEVWISHQRNVVELFQKLNVITDSKEDADLVQHICGVLDVNSFEVRGAAGVPGMGLKLRGIYTEAALMAHDCVPNVHLSVDDNFVMNIRAAVDIPQGQPILYNYTDPLQPTRERQKHLWIGKYFSCNCLRCKDPTELGTYMGGIRCPRCRSGNILLLPDSQEWACEKCNKNFNSGLMILTTLLIRDKLDTLDRSDPAELELFLSKLNSTLAPTHSIIVDVKQSIIAAYREIEPTKDNTRRKVDLCRELLPLLTIIEPGISRLRGITLYELHIGLVTLAQEFGENHWLREAQDVLKEAVSLLLYEPIASPEGELARQAVMELKTLNQLVAKQEKKKKKMDKHKK